MPNRYLYPSTVVIIRKAVGLLEEEWRPQRVMMTFVLRILKGLYGWLLDYAGKGLRAEAAVQVPIENIQGQTSKRGFMKSYLSPSFAV
jgi:hypothetical protein